MESSSERAETIPWQLVSEVLLKVGEIRLPVTGSSMLPSIWPGDVLYISNRCPSPLRLNEVVLCLRDKRLFVHRMVGSIHTKEGARWITRGDAMPQDDPPVSADAVLGRVTAIQRGSKRIHLYERVPFYSRVVSRLLRRYDWPARTLLRLRNFHRTRAAGNT